MSCALHAGLASASDDEILRWCGEHERIIVTHDHGFHQLIALAGATGPSVIRLRLQGLSYEQIASVIDSVARSYADVIEAGSLISVTGQRVRVRKLPV